MILLSRHEFVIRFGQLRNRLLGARLRNANMFDEFCQRYLVARRMKTAVEG